MAGESSPLEYLLPCLGCLELDPSWSYYPAPTFKVHTSACNKPISASGSKDGLVGGCSNEPCGAGWPEGQKESASVQRAAVLLFKGHLAQKLAVQLHPTHRQLEEVHFSC